MSGSAAPERFSGDQDRPEGFSNKQINELMQSFLG
jgi:hypothetical protein